MSNAVLSRDVKSGAHNTLNVCSYNCRGFNFTKKDYIDNLLTTNDVMFLQEHWLTDAQLSELGWIIPWYLRCRQRRNSLRATPWRVRHILAVQHVSGS